MESVRQFYVLESPGLQVSIQSGPAFLLHSHGAPGLTYTLQTSTNLLNWTDYTTVTADTNGVLEFLEMGISTRPACYYRLRWP